MPRLRAAAACAALLAFAAHGVPAAAADPAPAAAEAPKAKRQCFWANNVNSFTAVDDRTVNVRVGVRDYYRLELFGPCPDVDWTHKIGLVSRGGSSICDGFDATLLVPSSIGTQRCQVSKVRKLTPEEVAALNPKAKP